MPPKRKRKQNALGVLKLFRRDRFVIIDAPCPPAAKKGFLASPGAIAPGFVTGPLDESCRRSYCGGVRQPANKAIALRGDGQRLSPDANLSRSNAFGRFAWRPILHISAQSSGLLSCSLEHWRSRRQFLPFPSCFTSCSAAPSSTWSKRLRPDKRFTSTLHSSTHRSQPASFSPARRTSSSTSTSEPNWIAFIKKSWTISRFLEPGGQL
jgi:hypothetical protein